MICTGTVKGGVVVLGAGSSLPDGTEVTVIPKGLGSSPDAASSSSIWQKMTKLAQWSAEQPCTLPSDLAANHDHYLHGLPKRQ